MPAPTLVSYTQTTSWITAGSPNKATASISWNSGDVLLVIGGAEGFNDVLGTPTATGLSFTKAQDITNNGNTQCCAFAASAVAGSTSSSAVTVTNSGATGHWGFGVWVWRGSGGVGNSAKSANGNTSLTISMTPNTGNAAVCWGIFDFNAGAAFTATPTPTNTRQNFDGVNYSVGVFDVAPTAATSWGASSGGGAGPFSIVALEVKGTVAGGGSLLLMGVGN